MSSWGTQSVEENPTTTGSTDKTSSSDIKANSLRRRSLAGADPKEVTKVDSSKSLVVTSASTLATENLVYDISLASYPLITAQYTIAVNIKECQVSDSDVSVPDYTETKVIDLDQEGLNDLKFELTPFKSSSAETCGFNWFYQVSLNSDFDLGVH